MPTLPLSTAQSKSLKILKSTVQFDKQIGISAGEMTPQRLQMLNLRLLKRLKPFLYVPVAVAVFRVAENQIS